MNQLPEDPTETIVRAVLQEHIDLHQRVLIEQTAIIREITTLLIAALKAGGKLVFVGNGGSAATAQHITTELMGRFLQDRKALPALALSADPTLLTAVGNDLGFEQIFSRQVEGLVHQQDVVIGISTSGNSLNVLNAVHTARRKGAATIGFTGRHGGALQHAVDICLCSPSESTPRVQELHLTIWHAICELIERELIEGNRPGNKE